MSKILLVEDDQFLIEIYVTRFKIAGFEIETIAEGDLVVDKIKNSKPDLVLLDIVLPKMSGIEILKNIKKEDKEISKIPVVILSNLGGNDDIKEGMAAGAAAYIIKSQVIPSEVVKKVEQILKK